MINYSVLWVWDAAGWDSHLFCQRWKNFLQERLRQVNSISSLKNYYFFFIVVYVKWVMVSSVHCSSLVPTFRQQHSGPHHHNSQIIFTTDHSNNFQTNNFWFVVRLYSARCSACQNTFTKNDFVMRAKTKMFHLECFRCAACRRHLGN